MHLKFTSITTVFQNLSLNLTNRTKIEIGCNNLFRKKCQRFMYDEKLFETFELEAQERHYT